MRHITYDTAGNVISDEVIEDDMPPTPPTPEQQQIASLTTALGVVSAMVLDLTMEAPGDT